MNTDEQTRLQALERMTSRWYELEAARVDLVTEQDTIKSTLRALLPADGTYQAGQGTLTITPPQRRFDPSLAERVIPAPLLPRVQRTVIDRALAKRALPPELYEQCQAVAPGAQRIVRFS